MAGDEEIMHDFQVSDIGIEKLEPEPIRSEEGGDGEVELAVCETAFKITRSAACFDNRQAGGRELVWR